METLSKEVSNYEILEKILMSHKNGRAIIMNWPLITMDDVAELIIQKAITKDFRIKNWKKFAKIRKENGHELLQATGSAITKAIEEQNDKHEAIE